MNEYMHRDHLRDLWIQINEWHMNYLLTDENLYRVEQRKKLENCIKEYLCLAPHDRKFCFRETANVLRQSASSKETFSAYRAASAWDAIGTYAVNLLSQPWRKEYRVLKMYCGFYKHEIEANLVGAEVMLEAMGYKHVGNTTMVLEGPIDPDRISSVSRDSLVASVECQLLKMIWEDVSRRFQCQWLDVLEFREKHICTPENAVKGLMYQLHQREYQDQQQQQQQVALYHQQMTTAEAYGTSPFHPPPPPPPQGCLYGQAPTMPPPAHVGYYNYSPYALASSHAIYSLATQPRYGSLLNPQQPMMACSISPAQLHPSYYPAPMQHPVLKSQDVYPANGHCAMEQYRPPVPVAIQPPAPTAQIPVQNGYMHHGQLNLAQAPPQNYGCVVPTAQLIKLDTFPPASSEVQQLHATPDLSNSVLIPRSVSHHQNLHSNIMLQEKEDAYPKTVENSRVVNYLSDSSKTEQASRKNKDEGTGTFESWDYVFRNLESQGYSKDLGERPDILSPVNNPNLKGESRVLRNKETEALHLEDTLMEMRLEEMQRKLKGEGSQHRTMKINEALQKMKLESDADLVRVKHVPGELIRSSTSVYDNLSSPPKEITDPRPRHWASDPSKCSPGATKTNNTKTLPREVKKHESKRTVNNGFFSSVTLDPRKLAERSDVAVGSERCEGLGAAMKGAQGSRTRDADESDNQMTKEFANSGQEKTGKWECVTCTFHNDALREVCEMCGKSKVRGPESRPLASGGRECPQCTLVNEKDVGTCVACDCSLKDSPTYI